MKVLAINQVSGIITWQHDAAAALAIDGKLIATAEEERFNRLRHAKGYPHQAVEYCLKAGGISLQDIDLIVVGYKPWSFLTRFSIQWSFRGILSRLTTPFIFSSRLKELQKMSGAKVVYLDHHLCHAASAYRCSGFEEANVLTIDGAGETESFAFYVGKKGKLKRVWDIPFAKFFDTNAWRSIGHVYTSLTSFLNLGVHGEGKTMGLASYGEPRFDFSTILNIKNHKNYQIDRRNIRKFYATYERKDSKSELTQEHKDLAASLQKALENSIVNLAREAYEKTGIRNFALAGGVALNCNTNSKLLEQDFCDGLFIQPASNDGGISLGAVLEGVSMVGDADHIEFTNAYWGPSFTNDEIEKVLKESKVEYKKSDNIEADTAELVASGKIVGWFQGRMEIGPRALGNRTILANPCIDDMADQVNINIKHREVWRPFAPSITVEDVGKYFEGVEKVKESPFMLHTFYVKNQYRNILPSITHVDGSSRIQTVSQKQNPRYYKYLKELEKRTGHPITLNTSFNDAGEPIVCTPRDAVRCYFSTGFDALAIGDFLLVKNLNV